LKLRILHYSLGLPPYRGGGLTKYTKDLMIAQAECGHDVFLLYPSDLAFGFPNIKVKRNPDFNGVRVFELKNPLTVPLLYGVRNTKFLIRDTLQQQNVLNELLDEIKPDVVHIHTLMGMPIAFLRLLRQKGIRSVYTTHDYFGLCFKVNFINDLQELCDGPSAIKCAICNRNSPKNLFLRFRNEKFLIPLKRLASFKKGPGGVGTSMLKDKFNDYLLADKIDSFEKALHFYSESFKLMDLIHFNSTVTSTVFNNILGHTNCNIISITHRGIQDNRFIRKYEKNVLRMGFIGSMDTYKGFPYLKEVLMEIPKKFDWNLLVFGGAVGIDSDEENIVFKGKYNNDNLQEVFLQMDVLIVPSVCKETFSLITLEALSFGVPIIVSDNVGAKDIISELDSCFIFRSRSELKDLIIEILNDRYKLEVFNKKINEMQWKYDMMDHVQNVIAELYLK